MADIESKLGLNREKLIALAVLSGCDYSSGLPSVGKETALKFLHSLQHVDVIERLRSWFRDQKYEMLEKKVDAMVKKDSHCTHCQHLGTRSSHQTNGCEACDTKKTCRPVQPESADCKCEWHEQSAIKQKWKLELELRKKAKQVKMFPPEDVIREFLNKNDKVERVDVAWTRPKTSQFESFMSNTLRWKGQDSRENLFPVLTCWHLRNKNDNTCDTGLMPIRVVKERVVQGADFFEVEWQAEEFEGTPPTTTEPQKLFEEKYPEMVRCYNEKLDELRGKKSHRSQKTRTSENSFESPQKNRNGKEVVGDTAEKEKTAIEPLPTQPSESRGRRVTRDDGKPKAGL
uniref:Putative flap endonuclease gen protein 1 n=1 Tax=Ixodes ricinus TaxID=34613 RepID=V5HPS1_IXORI